MHINILTLFPEFFESPLSSGLMGRAVDAGLLSFSLINPRDFATDRHKSVDDTPYGGGPGMVMFLPPLAAAMQTIQEPGALLLMTPRGKPFSQKKAQNLSKSESLTLICGRYEGIDARFEDLYPVESVSVGDFVLNGGESAALSVIEAVSRLVPGFMGKIASGEEESFSGGLLEYPHYTRPEEFEGLKVPQIVTSGDHGRIATWRRQKSLETTLLRRPELLEEATLDKHDVKFLRSLPRPRLGRNLYTALLHHPVYDPRKKVTAVSLTNLDLHDISRVSRSYGLAGMYVQTILADQREMAERLVQHWVNGPGSRSNPDRAEAMSLIRLAASLDEIIDDVHERTGQIPYLAATSAVGKATVSASELRKVMDDRPVVLLFGTGHGLAREVMDRVDGTLPPIRYMDDYNHLSVRAAAAITLDRLLADAY
ncbi:MAG: tRNA (guanosine(37)-N1)-methyltransferase TrmD [Desulfovibrio sp.]|uniref:tRNA (guanosine(37)-N1)-methyltransferase TrmD n=1 Tax=Desulfovibrio sp. 7SRBS1 TaxID=3378064 RepID=UPI003B4078BB